MLRRRGISALLVAALWLSVAPSARAGVLSEDELEETSTELGVVARSFAFVLTGDILAPPFNLEDANPTSIGLFDLRLYFIKKAASWKVVFHNQLTAQTRSHSALGGLAVGRGLEPPRLLPLHLTAADEPTVALRSDVDWLYVAYNRGRVTLTLGRQPITFGRGKIWRPLDLIGTFALTEVDTEYKPGADAARVDVSLGAKTSVTVVASTGEYDRDRELDVALNASAFIARGKRSWGSGEMGVLLGYVRGDAVLGLDAVHDGGGYDVYVESSVTRTTNRSLSSRHGKGAFVAKAVAGATYKPTAKLTVTPEIMFNGFGTWEPDEYLGVATSARVAIGEQITWGLVYGSVFASWEAHPLLTIAGGALINVRDPSALGSLALNYSFSDNVVGLLGGYVPVGKRPSVSGAPRARSEYGVYPYFLFVELKAVL